MSPVISEPCVLIYAVARTITKEEKKKKKVSKFCFFSKRSPPMCCLSAQFEESLHCGETRLYTCWTDMKALVQCTVVWCSHWAQCSAIC